MTERLVRGSGRFGPGDHLSKLPTPDVVAMNVLFEAVFPSEPPTYMIVVPDWTIAPSVRGSGSASWLGELDHGTTAPGGAGHGSDRFPSGQKFTGLQARIPRSIVLLTVK